MITASHPTRQPDGAIDWTPELWQRELAAAITDPRELCAVLDLDPRLAAQALQVGTAFRLLVPRGFVRRMRRGDPGDPLLRQVLPMAEELLTAEAFSGDPLQERARLHGSGLLQKYRGRALLIATAACAVHCRYCFRREFPYGDTLGSERLSAALATLAADESIEELILSGGDPLTLSTRRLAALTQQLRPLTHLKRLRLHTRLPIVLPERIDTPLLEWLSSLPWPCVIVVHSNHANEIDGTVRAALERLTAAGARLLNQSVLLAGVNDSVEALHALSESLWDAGVLPYYLHLLDRVRGSAHFEVDETRARRLMAELAARLPGYLVPRLVREEPGAPAKTSIAPAPWSTVP
jgi:L-lysine 2,3-aminomutase